jgi:hypothetical protein
MGDHPMNASRWAGPVRIARAALVPGILVLAFVTLLASGCTTWRPTDSAPRELLANNAQITMRVTAAGAEPITLSAISVVGDTLYGHTHRRPVGLSYTGNEGFYRVAVPHGAIQLIEIQKTDAAKTTLLVATVSLTIAAIWIAIALDEDDSDPPPPNDNPSWLSCPIILCADDNGVWRIDSGTYAGAIMPALARRDVDNLEHARDRNGLVEVRLTGLSGETEHVDELALLSVDHDPGVSVAPDTRGAVRTLGAPAPPQSATDLRGGDALPRVRERDEWIWESAIVPRDPASARDLRDGLDLEFPRPEGAKAARLVIDAANTPWAMLLLRQVVEMHGQKTRAWYDDVAADSSRARRIRETMARETFLHVRVWTGDRWEYQGSIPDVGPESLKRQVVDLDLGRIEGSTVRVRLDCVPNLWMVDCVSIDFASETPIQTVSCPPERARDLRGRDVRAQLAGEDLDHYVIAPGDTAEVAFRVPPRIPGRSRSYLARTAGWYRMHTPETGAPQEELLARLESEPGAVARFAVERMNRAVAELARERD